jgi:hypothetical protein
MTAPAPEGTPAAPEAPAAVTPPWGSDADFDPAKAWKLIEGLRADKDALSKRPVLTDEAKEKLAAYDKTVAANQTELEKATTALTRYQTESESWRSRAVAAKVEALAGVDFADPTDAVNGLDPAKYLNAGGEIDEAAIKTDLAALLEAKPHYKRPEGAPTTRVPAANTAQGSSARGNTAQTPADQFAAIFQGALK